MFKKAFTLAELSLIFFILAILAILFYRTLKPDNVVYNHLYYSAYTQLSDAFLEVISDAPFDKDNKGNFTEKFFDKVNTVGNSGGVIDHEDTIIPYNELDGQYNENGNDAWENFGGNSATLSNNMKIRFDLFNYDNTENKILVATVDINGDNEPNQMNKDVIQFEINENGVLPIGDIETDPAINSGMLKFNVFSNFKDIMPGTPRIVTGEEYMVLNNVSYETAACQGNLPRHTYYETKEDGTRGCPQDNAILPDCNQEDEVTKSTLKCRAEAIKP